jgi:hypothetical protein
MWYLCAIQKGPEPETQTWFITGSDISDLNTDIATCLNDVVAVGGSSGASSTSGSGSLTISDVLLPALELKVLLVVVVDVQAESGRVDVAVTPDEETTEDRLGQNVEDAVEDGLGVGRDVVATLAQAPGNGVESPQDSGQGAAHEESLADVLAHGVGVLASFPGEDVDNIEECDAAKDEVAPLVAGPDKCADKAGDDHDPVDQNDVKDRRPGHTGSEEQVGEQQRSGDEPVDVADYQMLA